jgi:hypothetical protein
MSLSRFAEPLVIEIGRSRLLGGILVLGHAGAAAVGVFMPVPPVFRLILVVLLTLSLYYSLVRYALLSHPGAIVWLHLDAGNEWHVCQRDGNRYEVRPLSSSFIHPSLVILNLKIAGKMFPRSVILLPDAINATLLRRLRVRLILIAADAGRTKSPSRLSGFSR